EELALIIPFVERGVLIEAFVALQADQLGGVERGERLADFGLAYARLAFQQQRPLEEIHQPQRGRDVAVGDVADGGKAGGDVVARYLHAAYITASSCPRKRDVGWAKAAKRKRSGRAHQMVGTRSPLRFARLAHPTSPLSRGRRSAAVIHAARA